MAEIRDLNVQNKHQIPDKSSVTVGRRAFFWEEEKEKRGSSQTSSLLPTENIQRIKIRIKL